MSTGYQIKDQEGLYYLTLQVVGWADIFTRKIYREIVIDSLKYCQYKKGLEIYAYVIMSNHIHLLAKSANGNLSGIIRDFKRHTSKKIVKQVIEGNESRREWLINIFEFAGNFLDGISITESIVNVNFPVLFGISKSWSGLSQTEKIYVEQVLSEEEYTKLISLINEINKEL